MSKKQLYDKQIVAIMVKRYCLDHHGQNRMCPTCDALLNYVNERIERCPLGEKKTICQRCTIHCYSTQRRTQIKEVMNYAGKRMLFTHPLAAIRHLIMLVKSK